MLRRAARVDENQQSIVDALRAEGCSVQVLSDGRGVPDLLIGDPHTGANILVEVKIPIGGRMTPAQKRWHGEWKGKAHVAYGPGSALAILAHYRGRK